jgi:hypothetical protein
MSDIKLLLKIDRLETKIRELKIECHRLRYGKRPPDRRNAARRRALREIGEIVERTPLEVETEKLLKSAKRAHKRLSRADATRKAEEWLRSDAEFKEMRRKADKRRAKWSAGFRSPDFRSADTRTKLDKIADFAADTSITEHERANAIAKMNGRAQ